MATKKVTKKDTEEAPERLTRTAKTDEEVLESLDTGAEDKEADYLHKYQYMRERPLGHADSDPKDGKALVMKTQLLKQPRVRVMIPVDSGSDPSVPFDVTLNGYRLSLPRNQYIDVPQQVAEVIMNSHNQTQLALSRDRIDGNKAKESALG